MLTSQSRRSFAIAASMFMNSNSLPIALMQSLVITVPGLKWGHDDDVNAMVGRALTYLVLYSTLGMVVCRSGCASVRIFNPHIFRSVGVTVFGFCPRPTQNLPPMAK